MYCYKDGQFLQDCTMDEMIEHCAQFVGQPRTVARQETDNPSSKLLQPYSSHTLAIL